MYRINTPTKAPDLFGAGKHGFRNGDIGGGVVATKLNAEFWNMIQETICRFIEAAGLVLDENDYDQLTAAFMALMAANAFNINALTAETAPAVGDLYPLYDVSAGANRKMTLENLFKVINALTNKPTPDSAADYVALYSAADGAARKALLSSLSIFTKSFESAQQTITAGGSLTIAHGLGVVPKLVQPYLYCAVAQGNYSVGDLLPVNKLGNENSTGARGIALKQDATNLYIRYGGSSDSFCLLDWTSGGSFPFTNSSWRLVMRAWA